MKRFVISLAVLVFAQAALADGMIVPVEPRLRVSGNWVVKYHHVDIKVENQVASVVVDQAFENIGSGQIQVEYMFPVPPDAAIDSMTLSVDGKDYKAQLMKADEARKIYEDIVRAKKDPALLEYVGYGLVKTSAFPLQPGKPAKVIVSYKQTCKKDQDLVQVWYPLNTEKFSAKAIADVTVTADITSKSDIPMPYSPSHDITVDRKDARHVVAKYTGKDVLPTTDFLLYYKESNDDVGATLLTHQPTLDKDGYFMLLVSPNPSKADKVVAAKNVLLVLDHSGSMNDDGKIQQARDAVKYVLGNLNSEDNFNLVVYSDSVETLFDGMVPANEKNVKEAKDRVDHLEATGGTNINKALEKALALLPADKDTDKANRPSYILFMTDGRPTVGETDEGKIIAAAVDSNKSKARIFTFGVGYDVNVRLLDKLIEQNNGRSEYVKPKENIETKVASFYNKIKNPVMTNIKVQIAGLRTRECYPQELPDLFEGDQIVLAGRYFGEDVRKLSSREAGVYHTQLVVKGIYQGKERTFEYPVTIQPEGQNWRYEFVEKIWAIRRVGFLLDQIQLHGKNQEIIDELVRLSKDYGIMTPYTSFLADERTELSHVTAVREMAMKSAGELDEVTGARGQRGAYNRAVTKDNVKMQENTLSAGLAAARPTSAPGMAPTGADGSTMFGSSEQKGYEAGKKERLVNVQNVGNQAMFRRGQMWVASNASHIDPVKDKDKIRQVERFSDEYFKLVRANTIVENQMLATQADKEELLITLRGQVYQIR